MTEQISRHDMSEHKQKDAIKNVEANLQLYRVAVYGHSFIRNVTIIMTFEIFNVISIQNNVISLVLRENGKSKQVTDFIA
jgi:hypothetical protein